MQEGNWKRAIGYYERAIVHAADESKLGIWYSIGACHLHLEEHEAAVAAFATCLKRDPGFHRARNSLGFALMRAGKLEQAVQVLRGLPRLGSLSGLASRPKLP
jgi:tetratricopeptide (TPR) repeat protein